MRLLFVGFMIVGTLGLKRRADGTSAMATKVGVAIALVAAALLAACASFAPRPLEGNGFRERAVAKEDGSVRVTAAVPSRDESAAFFGVDVSAKGVQPVWLRIENMDTVDYIFLPIALDPNYFSPNEVAWKNRLFASGEKNESMAAFFETQQIPIKIESGQVHEGFVYTNLDPGVKYFEVMLIHNEGILLFDFAINVPGLVTDYSRVDFDALDSAARFDVDAVALGRQLDALPCCVFGPDGTTPGDPLNIVVIGDGEQVFLPFISRGWRVTETTSGGSVWRTVMSSVFNLRYLTSPISPLYLFDRRQDIALQKARDSVDERNHLRLWLTPWRYEGEEVWVGQISRDIGVRLSSKTLVTHKIDPDVDEARDYLLADLLFSGRLAAFGYHEGKGVVTRDEPRYNYTGDPYHTDGNWVVLLVSASQVPLEDLLELDW